MRFPHSRFGKARSFVGFALPPLQVRIDFFRTVRQTGTVFGKIGESLEKAAVRAKMKSGALHCPECGAKPVSLPEERVELMACGKCGTRASLSEWVAASIPGAAKGKAGEPPAGTRIRVAGDASGGKVWEIPASGKFGFFMLFSLLWLSITAIVSGGFLLTFLSGGKIEGNMPEWLLIPFFGIFWAVGLGTLYTGLRNMLARHRVSVGGGRLTLRREMLGRVSEKSLSCAGITTLEQREFYQQNYQPVYGIEIKGAEGKIRFGTTLEEAEKAWLVAELAEAALPKPASHASGGADGVVGGVLAPMKVGAAALTESFSAVIPGLGMRGFWAGLTFVLVAGGFASLAFTVMDRESWIGIRGIWLVFNSLFISFGLGMLGNALLGRGKERRIEGNATEISIRTYRNGLILKDKSFLRREVTDIRSSVSGNSNSTTMKRVELIVGDRAEKLASWVDAGEADALVRQVRGALGR